MHVAVAAVMAVAMGCQGKDTRREEDAARGDHSALGPQMPASAEMRQGGLARRNCERSRLGPEWQVLSTIGVTCTDDDECTKRPRGHCIGLPESHCSYGGQLGDIDESCAQDADCNRRSHGACMKLVRTTFCLYDECAQDSDCAGGKCQCPGDSGAGDPWCVVAGCDRDDDCAVGQVCRTDMSVVGVAPQRHCSSERDSCESDQDCADPLLCGFITSELRWSCRSLIIVH